MSVDEDTVDDMPLDPETEAIARGIADKLTPEMATELVLIGLMELPPTLPSHFTKSYRPISSAGNYIICEKSNGTAGSWKTVW